MSNNVKKTKGTPDKVDVHVGNRLKSRRSLIKISQQKLAKAVGVTFQQIQKYESGLNRISAGRLFQFSQILDVPVSYFFDNMAGKAGYGMSDNDQDAFQHEIKDDPMESKETYELVRVYYSIKDPEARKDIIKFIKSMSKTINSSE